MTTPFDAPDWRKLSREELDRGLNNGEAVAGSAEIVAGWERRSAELRKRYRRPSRSALRPARAQPHRFSEGARRARRRCCSSTAATGRPAPRRISRCLPKAPMAHGINVALIGYTLAPDATLDEIVAEIHAGIDFLGGAIARARRRRQGPRGVGLVGRRASHLDGAVASEGEGGHGDHRHLRSRADPRTPISTSSSGSTRRCRARNSPMMQAGGPMKPLSLVVGARRTAAAAQADRRFRRPSRPTWIAGDL